jgi:hypothetical protein
MHGDFSRRTLDAPTRVRKNGLPLFYPLTDRHHGAGRRNGGAGLFASIAQPVRVNGAVSGYFIGLPSANIPFR